ncbi:MAG: HAD family hydrolase [Chloroflexota bacterium]
MIRAILFDFYDTLVYRDEDVSRQARLDIARLLGVDIDLLNVLWRRHRDERMLGLIPTMAEYLAIVARELEIEVPPATVAEAVRIDRDSQRQSVHLYANTRRVLETLRKMGFNLGLLSNSSDSAQEPLIWLQLKSHFDTLVLSHEVGILKPDPRIYRLAAERLAVAPEECAFVADGGFGELDAAHELGMLAVKIEQERQSKDWGSSVHHDVLLGDISELIPIAEAWRSSPETGG